MEDFDDILSAFNSDEKPAEEKPAVAEPKPQYNNNGGYNNNNGYKKPYNGNSNFNGPKKDKVPSVWDMTSFRPEKVSMENAKQTKTFTFFSHGREEVSLTTIESVVKVAKALAKKGYVFRCIGDTKDVISSEICKIEGLETEFYLPFKKFNEDVTDPATKVPALKACNIAANYHGLFNMNTKVNIQLSPVERMKHASKIHVLLGKECNEHLGIMLLLNDAGDTSVVKKDNKVDYKKYGNILFPLQVAEDTNIKILNFKESGFNEKIVNFLKDLSETNSNQEI